MFYWKYNRFDPNSTISIPCCFENPTDLNSVTSLDPPKWRICSAAIHQTMWMRTPCFFHKVLSCKHPGLSLFFVMLRSKYGGTCAGRLTDLDHMTSGGGSAPQWGRTAGGNDHSWQNVEGSTVDSMSVCVCDVNCRFLLEKLNRQESSSLSRLPL